MSKYKMMIITHPELAVGFRLAGVEVQEARNGQEATSIIEDTLKVKEYGIIGIDTELNSQIDPKVMEDLEERGMPLLIPFPATEIYAWERVKREENYAANLIRNAIGYHIKLKR